MYPSFSGGPFCLLQVPRSVLHLFCAVPREAPSYGVVAKMEMGPDYGRDADEYRLLMSRGPVNKLPSLQGKLLRSCSSAHVNRLYVA